jgi:ABC-2 type transport system ATP-binding protein
MTAPAIETHGLGKRYGSSWALRDCSLVVPRGSVTALVGPNGAGKTTLLHLAIGLLRPTRGSVQVLGSSGRDAMHLVLPRIGFVAQDHPLFRGFSLSDMLTFGRRLNPRWDEALARARLERLGLALGQRVGRLSGGQQAQVALTLALAKRPELLVLDEPVASLDPLARREFLQSLMEAVAEGGVTVVLSSHIVSELERVCDHLVILSRGGVQLAGAIDEIRDGHRLLVGPRTDGARMARSHAVIEQSDSGRQTTLVVRDQGVVHETGWQVSELTLEEIVLAYLARTEAAAPGFEVPQLEVAS